MGEQYISGIFMWHGQPRQYLRVKSERDESLIGRQVQKVEHYPDMTVTKEYQVLEEIRREHTDEFYYVWYLVDGERKTIDRTAPMVEQNRADIDFIAIMTGVELGGEI